MGDRKTLRTYFCIGLANVYVTLVPPMSLLKVSFGKALEAPGQSWREEENVSQGSGVRG
jgi:hypothetical protein